MWRDGVYEIVVRSPLSARCLNGRIQRTTFCHPRRPEEDVLIASLFLSAIHLGKVVSALETYWEQMLERNAAIGKNAPRT
jgi:hypothetical protein